MATIPNIPSWEEFFETLCDPPELWKVKSDIFKDRQKKNIAWGKLLDVYMQIDPNANVDSLKKRVTNIRSCYRRELKKVEQSQRSGAGAEDEYVPNLWYFELLNFLRDQEVQISGVSTVDLEQDDKQSAVNDGSEHSSDAIASSSCSLKRKKSVVHQMAERNNLLKNALGRLSNREEKKKDDAGIFAESWATFYRKLSPIQQIFAKKAIEEILILGQLELLSLNSIRSHSSNDSSTQNSVHVQVDTGTYSDVQELLLDESFT